MSPLVSHSSSSAHTRKRLTLSVQGDSILVQEQNSSSDKWFEGYIYNIRKSGVDLRFHAAFRECQEGMRFHIRFKLNRMPIRRQHQALDADFLQDRILFPEIIHLPQRQVRSIAKTHLNLFNPLIANNEPQRQAILSILSLDPGSVPFIVFGP